MRLAAAESWRAGVWADVIDEPMYWSVQGALIAIVSGIALLRYVLDRRMSCASLRVFAEGHR